MAERVIPTKVPRRVAEPAPASPQKPWRVLAAEDPPRPKSPIPATDGRRASRTSGKPAAVARSVAMPTTVTELSRLLAGDGMLCVRKRKRDAGRARLAVPTESCEATLEPAGVMRPAVPDASPPEPCVRAVAPDASPEMDSPAQDLYEGIPDAEAAPHFDKVYSQLTRVIQAWPDLPASVQSAILAMIDVPGDTGS